MEFWRDYWKAIGGTWWVSLVGGLATAVTLVLAVVNSRRAWMWVAIALGVVVLVQLLGAYRNYRERERERESLPFLLDEQIRRGTRLEKELRKSLPHPYNIFTELDPHLQRVADFNRETYTLLFRSAPAYAADLSKYLGPYLEKETERQKKLLAAEQEAAQREKREVRQVRGQYTWQVLLRSTVDALRDIRKELGD